MIQLFAAVGSADLASKAPFQVKEDLEARFQKALVSDLKSNLPRDISYVAADDSIGALQRHMEVLYRNDLLKHDCSLVKVRVTVEVEFVK